MGCLSIGVVAAALAAILVPGLAAGQGIPVRTFQTASDFARAARLQRLAKGAQASTQPRVPPGIPGYYDPATKTFTIAARGDASALHGLPKILNVTAPTPSGAPTTYSGTFKVNINIAGVDKLDTVICTAYLFIIYNSPAKEGMNPFDFVAQGNTEFAAGTGGTVPLSFNFKSASMHHVSKVSVECKDRSGNTDFQEQYQVQSDTVPNGTTSVPANLTLESN